MCTVFFPLLRPRLFWLFLFSVCMYVFCALFRMKFFENSSSLFFFSVVHFHSLFWAVLFLLWNLQFWYGTKFLTTTYSNIEIEMAYFRKLAFSYQTYTCFTICISNRIKKINRILWWARYDIHCRYYIRMTVIINQIITVHFELKTLFVSMLKSGMSFVWWNLWLDAMHSIREHIHHIGNGFFMLKRRMVFSFTVYIYTIITGFVSCSFSYCLLACICGCVCVCAFYLLCNILTVKNNVRT